MYQHPKRAMPCAVACQGCSCVQVTWASRAFRSRSVAVRIIQSLWCSITGVVGSLARVTQDVCVPRFGAHSLVRGVHTMDPSHRSVRCSALAMCVFN